MKTKDVSIPSPCAADWREMTPVEGGRMCSLCENVVHDLSASSEAEARALLATPRTTPVCVRYHHDGAGQIVFATDASRTLVAGALLNRAKRVALAAALAFPLSSMACHEQVTGAPAPEMTSDVDAATPPIDLGVDTDAGASEAGPSKDGGTDADASDADADAP